jgi:tripartite-type tricarboxylate transporter receptor subunit TctC
VKTSTDGAIRRQGRIRIGLCAISVVAILGLGPTLAHAEYPTRPITLVVPFGAGGASDIAARALASAASRHIAHPVVVTNRTGAAGVTGSDAVRKAKADGYTLLLGRVGSQAMGPALNSKLPYKWDEFSIIGLLEQSPYACAVKADAPYMSMADLKAAIVANPGKVSYSSTGAGSGTGFAPLLMLKLMGLKPSDAVAIPYPAGEALAALIGGHVSFFCQNVSGLKGAIDGGQVRALISLTEERLATLPKVPSAVEAGLPGLARVSGWSALYGPPDLPVEVIKTWEDVLGKVKADPAWLESMKRIGSTSDIRGSSETQRFVEDQYKTYREIFESIGLAK